MHPKPNYAHCVVGAVLHRDAEISSLLRQIDELEQEIGQQREMATYWCNRAETLARELDALKKAHG